MGWREDIAKQVAGAAVYDSGEYFRDGRYKLRVSVLKLHEGNNGTSFIGEFKVLEASAVDSTITPNAVGTTASVVYNFTRQGNSALGNAKKLILELAGMTGDQLSEQQDAENTRAIAAGKQPTDILEMYLLKVTNESANAGKVNPLRGMMVAGETIRKATKDQRAKGAERSTWNCYINFQHVPDQTKETIAAGRAEMDSGETKAAPAPAPAPVVPAPVAAPAPVVPAPAPVVPAPVAAPAPAGGMLNGLID